MKDEYISYSCKRLKHPRNKEFVTVRVNIYNQKKAVTISIGIVVCDLLNINKDHRLSVFINKNDRNLILIKKSYDGYRLAWKPKNNFMAFTFRYETPDIFRLSQTTIIDYDINDEGSLVINLEKVKWSN